MLIQILRCFQLRKRLSWLTEKLKLGWKAVYGFKCNAQEDRDLALTVRRSKADVIQ